MLSSMMCVSLRRALPQNLEVVEIPVGTNFQTSCCKWLSPVDHVLCCVDVDQGTA